MYDLEMGGIEKNLIAQAKRFKQPLPDRIANKPRLKSGMDLFMLAFLDLQHDRAWLSGDVAQPLSITWRTICDYAEIYDITGNLLHEMLYFVRELDDAYIRHVNRKLKTK